MDLRLAFRAEQWVETLYQILNRLRSCEFWCDSEFITDFELHQLSYDDLCSCLEKPGMWLLTGSLTVYFFLNAYKLGD